MFLSALTDLDNMRTQGGLEEGATAAHMMLVGAIVTPTLASVTCARCRTDQTQRARCRSSPAPTTKVKGVVLISLYINSALLHAEIATVEG